MGKLIWSLAEAKLRIMRAAADTHSSAFLQLGGNMKDLPPPLPPNDIAVHLPGGDVVIALEAHAQEALRLRSVSPPPLSRT